VEKITLNLNYMDGGSHMEVLPSQHSLDRKEIKSVPPENSPEFILAARFQNNIFQVITDQRLDILKREGELTDQEIEKMTPEERSMKAMDEIMAFGDNYGAAYKFLIKTDIGLFNQVYSFEKENPGGVPKKDSSAEVKASYAQKKEKYDAEANQRKVLAEKILSELKTERMQLLNKIMVSLKVGKKIDRGGITLDEYLNFIQPSVEALLVNDKELMMSVMNDPDKAQKIFKDHLQDIADSRPEEIAKQGPN
jgi:hypothetical protein